MTETFYITTPIYYANSLPHLGHLYTTIVADAVRRYKKQRRFDTYFLTGTDEHGINIQRAAEKNSRSNQEQVDYISGELKRMFHDFRLDTENGGYDIFMRTTEPFHYEGVSHLWREIAKNTTPKGNPCIYKGFYEGWFCAPCAEFKTEEQYYIPEGSDIPHCPIHERPLDKIAEESYFFRLSDYDQFLIDVIENTPGLVRPDARKNEVLSFVRGGLLDLAITRQRSSLAWGVPVPDDPEHVMYVWMDALTNYITALGYGNAEKASVGFEKYWQNVVHLVGKDILRFHTVYWFSFLHAAGLPLPKTVFAHGMWLDSDGRKMGKTMGNVIEVDVLHEHFQVDAIRYFVFRDMVFGQDGKFGYENLIERANADLASGLGNLASRTFSMITKYRDGAIPSGKIAEENYLNAKRAGVSPDDQELASVVEHARDEFVRRFDNFEFSLALETAWTVIARVDKLISDAKPWELIKDEKQAETLNAVLYRACETLRWLCIQLYPIMPDASKNIYSQIGLGDDIAMIDPANLKWGELAAETRIGETVGVFPRIDKNKVMNEINEQLAVSDQRSVAATESEPGAIATGSQAAVEAVEEEVDNFITIDDFLKVELRVGEIKVAERIPNADKLLRFEIDLGEPEHRQILAGLAEYYDPETLIGRKVVVVANLKPRKMRGLESQGMICAASLEDGTGEKPALAAFIENVDIGARLEMIFIDSHCHIDGEQFDADRDEVVQRARDAGVAAMLNIGTGDPHSDDFKRAVAVAEQYDNVFASVGVHPHDAKLYDDAAEEHLIELAKSEKVIAWGEIGLDYYYDHSPRDVQRDVFRRQIRTARKLNLPIIIHSRDADDETVEILTKECSGIAESGKRIAENAFPGGIMHCFGGTAAMAEALLEIGFLISFAGNVTFKKADNLRDAARVVPLERLLIETDCPFLTPVPFRGKRNEPSFVVHTANFLADFYGVPLESIAEHTTRNFLNFFQLDLPHSP